MLVNVGFVFEVQVVVVDTSGILEDGVKDVSVPLDGNTDVVVFAEEGVLKLSVDDARTLGVILDVDPVSELLFVATLADEVLLDDIIVGVTSFDSHIVAVTVTVTV